MVFIAAQSVPVRVCYWDNKVLSVIVSCVVCDVVRVACVCVCTCVCDVHVGVRV